MRKGRPKKLNKPVTVCIVIEENRLNALDDLRGKYSRGEYINILTISDDLKTQKILKLNEELKQKEIELLKLSNPKNITSIQAFQKTIHSNFKNQFVEKLKEMPKTVRKFWADKIGCSINELNNYL